MTGKLKFLGSFVLLGAFALPVTSFAGDSPRLVQAADHVRRVYDPYTKTWHTWDDRETTSYRSYYDGNHRPYREYTKMNKAQQREYWKWRHDHDDHHDRDHDHDHDHDRH